MKIQPYDLLNRKEAFSIGDSVPKPLGFSAAGAAPPFRPLGRRSGRIPA